MLGMGGQPGVVPVGSLSLRMVTRERGKARDTSLPLSSIVPPRGRSHPRQEELDESRSGLR